MAEGGWWGGGGGGGGGLGINQISMLHSPSIWEQH